MTREQIEGQTRYVGIAQQQATSHILHSGMLLRFWYWAAMQVAYRYRVRTLETMFPPDALTVGHRVLVCDNEGDTKVLFQISKKECSFVGYYHSTRANAMITVEAVGNISSPHPDHLHGHCIQKQSVP